MRLSMTELVFMNSVTKGPEPLNIQLKLPVLALKARVIDDTLDTLQAKYILDTDRKLTKAGLIPLRLLSFIKMRTSIFSLTGCGLPGLPTANGFFWFR